MELSERLVIPDTTAAMAHNNRVKPAYPTRTASGSAIFVADITNAVTNFIEKLCWEWSISNPTGVGLADTDYLVNLARTNTGTNSHSPPQLG